MLLEYVLLNNSEKHNIHFEKGRIDGNILKPWMFKTFSTHVPFSLMTKKKTKQILLFFFCVSNFSICSLIFTIYRKTFKRLRGTGGGEKEVGGKIFF